MQITRSKSQLFYSKTHSKLNKYIVFLICVHDIVLGSEDIMKLNKLDTVPVFTI